MWFKHFPVWSYTIPKWDRELWNRLSAQSLPFSPWWSGKSGIFLRAGSARWIPSPVFQMAQGGSFPLGRYDPWHYILCLLCGIGSKNWYLSQNSKSFLCHLTISCYFRCFRIVEISLSGKCEALSLFCISSRNEQMSSARKTHFSSAHSLPHNISTTMTRSLWFWRWMRRLKNIILTNLSVFHQNKEWVWQKKIIFRLRQSSKRTWGRQFSWTWDSLWHFSPPPKIG